MEVTPPTGAEVLTAPQAVNVLHVRCPTCQRPPGLKCIGSQKFVGGTVQPADYIKPHYARRELARIRATGITR